MKRKDKLELLPKYLNKICRKLNEKYFEGILDDVVIYLDLNTKYYSKLDLKKNMAEKEDNKYIIRISFGVLMQPIEIIIAEMLHPMIHLKNIKDGIKDTSREGNTYHNEKFKCSAEKIGLIAIKDEKYGWSHLQINEEILDFIIENKWTDINVKLVNKPIYNELIQEYIEQENIEKEEKRKNTPSFTYKCPDCGNKIKTHKEATIFCKECGCDYIEIRKKVKN